MEEGGNLSREDSQRLRKNNFVDGGIRQREGSLKVCSDRAKGKFSLVPVSLFFSFRTVNDVSSKLASNATSAEWQENVRNS